MILYEDVFPDLWIGGDSIAQGFFNKYQPHFKRGDRAKQLITACF